jgi:Mg-chelatase subunit ChlD
VLHDLTTCSREQFQLSHLLVFTDGDLKGPEAERPRQEVAKEMAEAKTNCDAR